MAIETIVKSETWDTLVRLLALSPREADIVERILRLDDNELSIAEHLNISSHTVHTHLERLYRKLAVSTRAQLVTKIFVAYAAMTLPPAVPATRVKRVRADSRRVVARSPVSASAASRRMNGNHR